MERLERFYFTQLHKKSFDDSTCQEQGRFFKCIYAILPSGLKDGRNKLYKALKAFADHTGQDLDTFLNQSLSVDGKAMQPYHRFDYISDKVIPDLKDSVHKAALVECAMRLRSYVNDFKWRKKWHICKFLRLPPSPERLNNHSEQVIEKLLTVS